MSLFEFNKEKKKQLVDLVSRRIFDHYSLKNESELDQSLEEMIYWEKKRSKKYKYWDQYKEQYLQSSLDAKKELLKGSIDHYSSQIVGNFNPAVYHLSAKLIPPFLNLLLNALSFKRLWNFRDSIVNESIVMTGNISFIRSLSTKGTLVFVPTHLSNLDSILMGTALYYADLPPVMYGAGLNLFKNKIIGFFMNNLGAYKVDRLRIHQVYKDVLKEYAASSVQLGFHNLFFPGGTRSRSGSVEKKLKLGLLGTSLKAYIRNLEENKKHPNVYIIPVNLNAHLTLEAETLINDFLAATGQSRYIIENDEFSKLGRLYSYFKNIMHLNSKTFVHFGDPLDPFGNKVCQDGSSVDYHGRVIDISKYVKQDEAILYDEDRDQNYTKELSRTLVDVFHCNNRVLSTNLLAFTLYEMIANRYPDFDIYKLLRTYTYHRAIPLKDVYEKLEKVWQFLEQLSNQGRIIYGSYLKNLDAQDIVNEALKIFASYHQRRTVYRVGDELWIGDLLLLYYYHNRLVGYNLEDMLKGAL